MVMGITGFGDLEAVVMEVLWSRTEPSTVRSVHDELVTKRQIAYTTVMSTMDNLFRKGWLQREKVGLAYSYRPVMSREEHSAQLMRTVFESGGDSELILNFFLEQIVDDDSTKLRQALKRFTEGGHDERGHVSPRLCDGVELVGSGVVHRPDLGRHSSEAFGGKLVGGRGDRVIRLGGGAGDPDRGCRPQPDHAQRTDVLRRDIGDRQRGDATAHRGHGFGRRTARSHCRGGDQHHPPCDRHVVQDAARQSPTRGSGPDHRQATDHPGVVAITAGQPTAYCVSGGRQRAIVVTTAALGC